jgi:hypothetical protein
MLRGGVPTVARRSTCVPGLVPATVALTFLVSCSGSSVPLPRFPQVEQAQEAIEGGGERYRDHRTCMGASKTVAGLIECMHAAKWQFVAPSGVFPEPECWDAREREQLDRVAPHCFVRAAERR